MVRSAGPSMADKQASEHFLRLSGAGGLQLYEQWKRQRPPGTIKTDLLTMPFAATAGSGQLRVNEESADRQRARVFLWLDRQFPNAKVPIGVLESLEFCQRCWWLGCSLTQGATLREHNLRSGLQWP